MVFQSTIVATEPPEQFNSSLSDFFWFQLGQFADKTLIIDFESKRKWTGGQIKSSTALIAQNLQSLAKLKPADSCVFFYKNCDYLQLSALAVLLCGASVCAGAHEDPQTEHQYMIELMQPRVVFSTSELLDELMRIRANLKLEFAIVLLDDGDGTTVANRQPFVLGLHTQLLLPPPPPAGSDQSAQFKPAPIDDPNWPAFILLTSGSTGRPKPVSRSHANSLNVCFTLEGAQHLWHLHGDSVLAGHLQLDHGTGLFCLKMTLAKGMTLVVMHGFQPAQMLEAIEQYKITDVVLGSAFVHNDFVCKAGELQRRDLSSLRNLIAVGSPLASHSMANEFMQKFPNCSIRQAFGMTECSFLSIVARDKSAEDSDSVGNLLPGFKLKLVDRTSQEEISEFDREGELYVSSAKVSPGYLGARFADQTKAAFNQLQSDYYKTNDICTIGRDGRLKIRGRYSEVLCLHDGWKVLPFEIEQTMLQHARVKEVAVVGIPHPELPTCHAPRAYIVLEAPSGQSNGKQHQNGQAGQPIEEELLEFARQHLSEPKHLVGGIKIMDELPRISIGKVDKKLLKQQDGYL